MKRLTLYAVITNRRVRKEQRRADLIRQQVEVLLGIGRSSSKAKPSNIQNPS